MLESSRRRILSNLPESALVIDIGGWGQPFPRADFVVDVMPYETRGLYGRESDPEEERFSAGTWAQRDVCDSEPLPFSDDQFDFAICSHTLEDVRDPVRVCHELSRIAKAGYVEVPSRLIEQAMGVEGPWAGWGHHRWLIDVVDGCLRFVFKHQIVNHERRYRFPPGFEDGLDEEERVTTLWWEGRVDAYEEILITREEADVYLGGFVAANRRRVAIPLRHRVADATPGRVRSMLARLAPR